MKAEEECIYNGEFDQSMVDGGSGGGGGDGEETATTSCHLVMEVMAWKEEYRSKGFDVGFILWQGRVSKVEESRG
ncbi:hypothetical protein L6452_26358 [Arctium lappa]|uniref:Uncharacterized protein n=1 Tax=Arctium lappa TaxID=4217 RepID=A0ACB9ABW4_ARCLA|nr:hypothetical protein L6452_26358 [Arctium lappa]